ncbi:helix-turn-helix transcriptional regulator [Carnobacteriaceae bacterium zg-ZUI78]|nr:helix-turn-helix transcriptional regulator [Carnobacteriaceae bacterium zg-ZUI78]
MQIRLYELRKINGLTQEELAKKMNISVVSFRNKELGKSEFTQDEMFFLSNFFNKSVDEIFSPRK